MLLIYLFYTVYYFAYFYHIPLLVFFIQVFSISVMSFSTALFIVYLKMKNEIILKYLNQIKWLKLTKKIKLQTFMVFF